MGLRDWIRGKSQSPENRAQQEREEAKRGVQQSPGITTQQLGASYGVQVIEDEALTLIQSALRARQSGNFKASFEMYQQALAIQPDSVDAHNGLAGTYIELGEYDKAVKEHRLAIQYAPSHLGDKVQVIYVNLGNAILKKGIKPSAIQEFERAVEDLPKSSGYFSARGLMYFKLNDYRKAQADLEKVLTIDDSGLCAQLAQKILGDIRQQLRA